MVLGDGGEKTVQSELTVGARHGKHTHTAEQCRGGLGVVALCTVKMCV